MHMFVLDKNEQTKKRPKQQKRSIDSPSKRITIINYNKSFLFKQIGCADM